MNNNLDSRSSKVMVTLCAVTTVIACINLIYVGITGGKILPSIGVVACNILLLITQIVYMRKKQYSKSNKP